MDIETKTQLIVIEQILKVKYIPKINNQQTIILIYLSQQIIQYVINTVINSCQKDHLVIKETY